MCNKVKDNRFSVLGRPKKIWAIGSIHGDIDRLMKLHDALYSKVSPGDRVVYLGNYTGYGPHSREVIDELLMFRRLILAQPGMKPSDITYLRGQQEDMWQKLTQLQFEFHPVDTLLGMMGSGLSATMQSYDICPHDGIMAAREGIPSLTRWTNNIRKTIKQNAGHDCFMTHSKRAAYTQYEGRSPILFVNAGLNAHKSLDEQDTDFWSSDTSFTQMTNSYDPFEKVVRGYDHTHGGVHLNCVTATLDGGCGFGGSLVCAQMSANGEFHELLEA